MHTMFRKLISPTSLLLLTLALSFQAVQAAHNSLKTYPVPDEVTPGSNFDVSVRLLNGEWKKLDTFQVKLEEINITTGGAMIHTGSMAYFDFSGSVEVSVTYSAGSISAARVRPDSYGIVPAVKHNTMTFSLNTPRNLVVHATENVFDVLHLFSNSIAKDVPDEDDPDVIYFGPGYHKPNGTILIPDGKTLYLEGGAVVEAQVNIDNATDVAIRGHGVLYHPPGGTISAVRSKNVVVEDVIVVNPNGNTFNTAESDGILIRGIRSFSAVGWGDGIDVFSSKNVMIDGIFMRNSDDCIALYNHRNDWYGDSGNITIQNSSLWADAAHPINIGTHGNTDNPETMSGVTIRNMDILDHREPQMGYQGCIAINPGDSNLIENVLIEDVRVENFRLGQLITMMVMFNTQYNTSPGRGISNVTVRNLSYKGDKLNTAIMTGYNETRSINHVTFENLTINSLLISDTMQKPAWYMTSDYVPMYVNEHVKNLTFVT